MAYLSLALVAFLAGNLLTVIITWVSADGIAFLYLLRRSDSEEAVKGLTRRFHVQIVSVLAVLIAGSLSGLAGAEAQSGLVALLLSLAVLMRVGLWPLHIGLPALPGVRRGMGALIRLLPVGMGLVLIGRLFPAEVPAPAQILLLVMGGVSVLVGSVQWMTVREAVGERPYLVLIGAGMGVTVASIGGTAEIAAVGVGVTTILMAMLLSALQIFSRRQRWLAVLASLLMIGVPFSPMHLVYDSIRPPFPLPIVIAGVILGVGAVSLAVGGFGLARGALVPWQEAEQFIRRTYAVGLSVPVFGALAAGVVLGATPSLETTAMAGAALALAIFIHYGLRRERLEQLAEIPSQLGLRTSQLGDQWLAGASWIISTSAGAVRLIGRAMEGRAAMLWIYVVVLLLGLLLIGSGAAT
jgi:hypothetical protein